ncbi:MAG: cation diffusion facilitator family transporter [Gammaproteobacteria bacterium]|jgi:cation diffusion facilitator family transporter|nr:cation diffusion facilitator family transporter [Gammaproteobacteria bacterium]MDX2462304.1 cation diffusion facilitator family transporter [Gammaproteobacteria bacterium]
MTEAVPVLSLKERYRQVRRVTLVGSAVDLTLGVIKIAGGWLSHSQALIADGVHSLSDLATDVLVLYAAKHAHAEADEDHPYGHARIETAATVGLGVALIFVSIGIVYDSVSRLLHADTLVVPESWAIGLAAISVVSKEAVYHYSMRYARSLNSDLLRANAWHSRSDAISSVVVIIGVCGALLGYTYLDAVAALLVAIMIGKIGFDVAKSSVSELIDTGLDSDQLDDLRDTIQSVDGVENLHLLRTRRMAGQVLVDVHLILSDPRVSVSEGHQISETVRSVLMRRTENIADVTVHIDPEDDEHAAPGRHLALRDQVLRRLQACWQDLPAAQQIRHVNLHYLNGQIHVEVELPLALGADPDSAAEHFRAFNAAAAEDPDIAGIRLLYA